MEETEQERIRRIARRLLERLEQAAEELDTVTATFREKVKTENGEQITEFEKRLPRRKGIVDRGGLKQLTGVLRELEAVLCSDPELDNRERESRLLRLERELKDDSGGLTVTIEGEAEDYAC